MDDRFNTAAGWALFAGIVALGGTILTGEYFAHEKVEKGGYEVADAAPSGGGGATAAKPVDFSAGDPAKGAELFKKCASCHTITQGGAVGVGPNLYGVMGQKHGRMAGFSYSPGMTAMTGVWDWAAMDSWLTSPKKYVNGTKMSFAGLSNPQDRADIIRYINEQGSNLPVPPPPAADAGEAAAASGEEGAKAADATAAPAADAAAPAKK
jgi:cytochrome c